MGIKSVLWILAILRGAYGVMGPFVLVHTKRVFSGGTFSCLYGKSDMDPWLAN